MQTKKNIEKIKNINIPPQKVLKPVYDPQVARCKKVALNWMITKARRGKET